MDNLTPIQRVVNAAAEKKILKKSLAETIGVPVTTFSTWIGRGTDFPASYVVPLADALGVHPLWILTGEEQMMPKVPENYVDLRDDELFLVQTFRALDVEGRIVVANRAVEEMRRVKTDSTIAAGDAGAS